VPKELIDLRYKMLDNRRFAKKKLIVEKRNELIVEERMMFGSTSRQSHRFVSIDSSSV
jgi:hypothetical protein